MIKKYYSAEGKPFTEKATKYDKRKQRKRYFTHSLLESEKSLQETFNEVLNKSQERMEKRNDV